MEREEREREREQGTKLIGLIGPGCLNTLNWFFWPRSYVVVYGLQ